MREHKTNRHRLRHLMEDRGLPIRVGNQRYLIRFAENPSYETRVLDFTRNNRIPLFRIIDEDMEYDHRRLAFVLTASEFTEMTVHRLPRFLAELSWHTGMIYDMEVRNLRTKASYYVNCYRCRHFFYTRKG